MRAPAPEFREDVQLYAALRLNADAYDVALRVLIGLRQRVFDVMVMEELTYRETADRIGGLSYSTLYRWITQGSTHLNMANLISVIQWLQDNDY